MFTDDEAREIAVDWEDRARTARLRDYVLGYPVLGEAEVNELLTEIHNGDPIEEADDDDPWDDASVEPDRSMGLAFDRGHASAWFKDRG